MESELMEPLLPMTQTVNSWQFSLQEQPDHNDPLVQMVHKVFKVSNDQHDHNDHKAYHEPMEQVVERLQVYHQQMLIYQFLTQLIIQYSPQTLELELIK